MQVTPYLMFNGNCEEALKFYEDALGGEIRDLMRFEGSPVEDKTDDKQKVLHSQFYVNGNLLMMASDTGQGAPQAGPGGMVHLSLNFKDEGHIRNVFAKLSDGGTVTMRLEDTFWGALFGMVTDQYGVNWMVNYDKPKS